jgi:hypothetical protein
VGTSLGSYPADGKRADASPGIRTPVCFSFVRTDSWPVPRTRSTTALGRRGLLQVASSSAFGTTPGISQSLLVLDRRSGPDCDGDGLNDFVELIENPSLDANQNLAPDGCPGG